MRIPIVSYDPEGDILYIAGEGREADCLELAPGLHLERDENGEIIGLEIMRTSQMLKGVMGPMSERLARPAS